MDFHDAKKVIGYYSKTKAEATGLVLKAVREHGLDASIVYPSGILGPNDYNFGLITSSIKLGFHSRPLYETIRDTIE